MPVRFVYDIICIVMILWMIRSYARRGFLSDVVDLCGNLASLLAAGVVSRRLAGGIFDTVIRPGLESGVAKTIRTEGLNVYNIADKYAGFLPESLREKLLEGVDAAISASAPNAAAQVVAEVLEPLVMPLVVAVLFFILYALCRVLVSTLSTMFTLANRIPLAGGINRTMGMVLGAAAGALYVYLFYCVAWGVMLITGGRIPFLTEEILSGSLIFGLLERINPFL